MWRLYWRITNGYWRDDLYTPKDILRFWFNIPHIIKIFKKHKNEKRSTKLLGIFYVVLCMALEPLQFVIYYGTIPLRAVSEWFCNIGKD